jgi:hypothetical protein
VRTFWDVAVTSCALLLAGCTGVPVMTTTNSTPANQVQGTALKGRVHGGQNPISGAQVYLYAADATAYDHASDSLLKSPGYVTTDGSGSFSITSDYTCPSASTQVYLYAVGGNPGSGANSAAGLLAGLGSCGSLNSSTLVFVNEVSTIATAYAIAGYATDATHVSSSGSTLATTGIANAFAAATNLETLGTGTALATTPAGNGTVPQSEINTLANILAACVNSNGTVSGPTNPTPCYTLFTNSLSGGATGTQPTDTATAAINIAHNPGANIAALYGLQTGNAVFQPSLSVAPNDFTVGLNFTGGGIDFPEGIAIDSSGNAWIPSFYDNSLTELSSSGSILSGANGFTGGGLDDAAGIGIDGSSDVWVLNYLDLSVTEFSDSGAILSGTTGYPLGGVEEPAGIAIDASENVWIGDHISNRITKMSSSGTILSGTYGYNGGGATNTSDIAIDVSGNAWITNPYYSNVTEVSNQGTLLSGEAGYTGGGMEYPLAIAIDGSGNAWVTNDNGTSASGTGTGNSVTKLSNTGTILSGAKGFTGGGLSVGCDGIAIDGSGNVWVTILSKNRVAELSNSGNILSGTGGYAGAGMYQPILIAVDGSGNVWIGNSNTSVSEFIGAATPVVTPVVANLRAPYGASAVNMP